MGGSPDGKSSLATVEVYNPVANTWTPLEASLNTPRVGLAAATDLNGNLYAIAGENSHVLNSVEVYDPSSSTLNWNPLAASLNTPRYLPAATTGMDGKIYVIGGSTTGAYKSAVSSVEVYDPANPGAGWITLSAMLNTARFGLAAVTGQDGKIYAIGGQNLHGANLNSVEVYDPGASTPQWTMISNPLNSARYGLVAVNTPDGRIFAVGGNSLSSFEAYRPIAPTLQATLSGGQTGNSDWWIAAPSLILSATENWGPGISGIIYSENGGAPTTVSGASTTILFTQDGIYNIMASSLDLVGNSSRSVTTGVKLDTTPPVTVESESNSQITLTATDNLSGVASTPIRWMAEH